MLCEGYTHLEESDDGQSYCVPTEEYTKAADQYVKKTTAADQSSSMSFLEETQTDEVHQTADQVESAFL